MLFRQRNNQSETKIVHFTWIEALANKGKILKEEVEKFPIPEEMMEWAMQLVRKWEDEEAE